MRGVVTGQIQQRKLLHDYRDLRVIRGCKVDKEVKEKLE